jgi:hypothetical protein
MGYPLLLPGLLVGWTGGACVRLYAFSDQPITKLGCEILVFHFRLPYGLFRRSALIRANDPLAAAAA